LVAGRRGHDALESGEVDAGLVWAGQVVGLIDDIPTCEALLSRIVSECRARLAAAALLATAH
jgi:NADH:quinone reductase (non-electrogenic)